MVRASAISASEPRVRHGDSIGAPRLPDSLYEYMVFINWETVVPKPFAGKSPELLHGYDNVHVETSIRDDWATTRQLQGVLARTA